MIVETQAALPPTGHTDVLAAIHAASAKTGADFDYLLATAMRESSLDAHAKSKGSSATGLFQFIEQTWLGLVKRYGERHGLSDFADAIKGTGGHFSVASHDTRTAILALRKNPEFSALMAGEAANEMKQSLECKLGREVCGGELYAAHFLGEGGARHLIELKDKNPNCAADLEFPQAAKANRNVFYHADGKAKTVGELYDWAVELPEIPASAPEADAPLRIATSQIRAATLAPKAVDPFKAESRIVDASALRLAAKPEHDTRRPTARPTLDWMNLAPASPRQTAMLPQSPLLLSPGVVEILASLTPMSAVFGKRTG